MTVERKGWLALYGKIFLLSLNGLFAKLIPLDAVSTTQLRSVVAGVAILLFCWLRGSSWRLNGWRQTLGVYGLGILLGAHWVTYFHAMQVSTIAVGMLALFSYPVITILLEPLFSSGRYRLHVRDVLAGLLVMAGLVVMIWDQLSGLGDSPIVSGCLWGVFSALLFSVRNLLLKHHYAQVPSGTLVLHQVFAIALLLLVFVDFPELPNLQSQDWLLLVLLGVFTTAGAHTLLAVSLKRLAVKTVSIVGCLQPVLGAVLAWLLLGEIASGWVVAGGAIILSVALYESLKK